MQNVCVVVGGVVWGGVVWCGVGVGEWGEGGGVGGGGGADNVYMESLCRLTMTMHLIQVAEHLGVRLLASPPHRALDNQQLLAIEG